MAEHRILFEASPKRVRAVANGVTVADSIRAGLLLETKYRPGYYFPREDVRADLLTKSGLIAPSPTRGEATYWNLDAGGKTLENAAWSYEAPPESVAAMKGFVAFAPDKIDHWFEEDEEVFGHPRDPYHRIDCRESHRRVRVRLGDDVIADTKRAVFLFETGHPTRYYIPPADVRPGLLTPTKRSSTCPYKGNASYWTVTLGNRVVEDAVWGYLDPIPDCPQIKGLYCFYPEKVDAIEVDPPGR